MKRQAIKTARRQSTRRAQILVGKLALLALLAAMNCACSSTDGGNLEGGLTRPDVRNSASRILACKSTDRQIANQGQCLQDDAACYQIANGEWCTGERGNVCPAGSQALTADACPSGARCFRISESLECVIQP